MKDKEKIKKIISGYRRYKKERNEYLEGWKRCKADFINYKKEEGDRIEKRVQKEREEFVLKILPILNNFRRAQSEVEKRGEDTAGDIYHGFLKIKKQLETFLASLGVEEIETINKEFDPHIHDAIEVIEEKGKESGIIVEELEKGYIMNNNVIRPAKVKVNK